MIALRGLTYRYPGTRDPALRDISLDLEAGEIVGVAGANGSGKSTLCLVLAGLAPRVLGGSITGSMTIDGLDAGELAMHELAARVGIGFQSPATQLSGVSATVYEEVAFGPSTLGRASSKVIEQTEAALEAVGITHLASRDPGDVSGGEQQLTALAGLLAARTSQIVLDEPTSQLDPHAARRVGRAVKRLAAEGLGVLIAEHRTDLMLELCDRVVVLDHGGIVFDGAPRDALDGDRVAELGVAEPTALRLERLTAAFA